MAEADVKRKGVALPKWLIQGFLYGIVLALIMYYAGTVAMVAAPALFPPGLDIVSGAVGFLSSLGIAYTKDISQ